MTLELATKLKSLGVKQESLFYWCPMYVNADMAIDAGDRNLEGQIHSYELEYTNGYNNSQDCVSAFTVAELGEMLPREYVKDEIIWELRSRKQLQDGKLAMPNGLNLKTTALTLIGVRF